MNDNWRTAQEWVTATAIYDSITAKKVEFKYELRNEYKIKDYKICSYVNVSYISYIQPLHYGA